MVSWQAQILYSVLLAKRRLRHGNEPLDVNTGRSNLERAAELFRPIVYADHSSVSADGVSCEWVIPPNAGRRVILYLHGGAYNAGSPHSHRALAGNIAHASGSRALTVDYRLAPEHPYPAALEDALQAYQWLIDSGVPSSQITVGGDSAGGGLTIALLVALREGGLPMPASAVVLSPWTDLSARSRSDPCCGIRGDSWQSNANADYVVDGNKLCLAAGLYLDGIPPRTAFVSPMYADLSGLPPLLIHVGSQEVLLSDSLHLAEHARLAGVDTSLYIGEGMQHVWHFAANFMPEARLAVRQVGLFVCNHAPASRSRREYFT